MGTGLECEEEQTKHMLQGGKRDAIKCNSATVIHKLVLQQRKWQLRRKKGLVTAKQKKRKVTERKADR